MERGQWMWGRDGHRWFFQSGSLALDFGYTGDFGYGRPEWERLHGSEDLEHWVARHLDALDRRVTRAEFRRALQVRGAISALAIAAADGGAPATKDIDVINNAVRRPPLRPHLSGGSAHPVPVTMEAALSTIAEDAVAILTSPDHRVRRCAGEGCELVFFDHSRPNARRWCSMARCGNRAKIKTHRSTEP